MNVSNILSIIALVISVVALAIVLTKNPQELPDSENSQPASKKPTATPKDKHGPWLTGNSEENFRIVEKHLRGFDMAMVEVGYRFNALYFAGKDENWPYAEYQIKKIEKSIQLAIQRRPNRKKPAEDFLANDLIPVKNAVTNQDSKEFSASIQTMKNGCIKCHVISGYPSFIVQFPKISQTSIVEESAQETYSTKTDQ